ncbi:MAG: hypothetical protein A2452_10095 [Candidatus Firestonebacteria bacterium RIFOXYC2_FULL_39_67]|nr:MAG: hypothetical protein A2536_04540 [Candidatus Firestonebacteria bacterium RIFOXYD2_FULL_39_29]OGF56723.1 MAG: hypothetical protein A2497_07885 [Candidatus Firestonebacteria bacterium RifOxyC12_full_39_7]OGF57371.1 MAG: hypothetical protein A2452_10095 [Candidatus Firestonebacteria bacterium RIFOXYC2_FULL_39_67]
MTDFSVIERRRFVRVSTERHLKFKIISEKKDVIFEWVEALTKSLSLGGLMIEVNNLEENLKQFLTEKNVTLEIQLSLPGDKDIQLQGKPVFLNLLGKISWGTKTKTSNFIGVEFLGLSQEAEQALKAFMIKEYLKKYKSV